MNVLSALRLGRPVFHDTMSGFYYVWNEASKISVFQIVGNDVLYVDTFRTEACDSVEALNDAKWYNNQTAAEIAANTAPVGV